MFILLANTLAFTKKDMANYESPTKPTIIESPPKPPTFAESPSKLTIFIESPPKPPISSKSRAKSSVSSKSPITKLFQATVEDAPEDLEELYRPTNITPKLTATPKPVAAPNITEPAKQLRYFIRSIRKRAGSKTAKD